MNSDLSAEALSNNLVLLYTNPHANFIVEKDESLSTISRFNFIGRVWKWIQDFCFKDSITKKVNQVILASLKEASKEAIKAGLPRINRNNEELIKIVVKIQEASQFEDCTEIQEHCKKVLDLFPKQTVYDIFKQA